MKEWVRSRVFMWFSRGQWNEIPVYIEPDVDEWDLRDLGEHFGPQNTPRRFRLGHLNGYSKPQKEGDFEFTIEWNQRTKTGVGLELFGDPRNLDHPFYEANRKHIEERISPTDGRLIGGVTSIVVSSKGQQRFEVEVSFNSLRGEHYTDSVVRIFLEIADRLGVPRKKVWESSMSFDQDAFVMVGGEWMLKREFFEKRIRARFA